MQRWKLILAYDGTSFHGWQIQPRLRTVQGTLASALAAITGESVLPQGSGRTDAGVHALHQVASFALEAPIPPANLLRALNRTLPPAVRVLEAEHAHADFHARHSAVSKTYEYRIFERHPPECDRKKDVAEDRERVCPPILAPFVWDCPFRLDLALASRAATQIMGEHDFSSFAAADPDLSARNTPDPRSSVRQILASGWSRERVTEAELLVYRVTGSGFLHHMVRNLVGTFVDVARRRLAPDATAGILAARNRSLAGATAPARGLFLVQVEYAANSAPSAQGLRAEESAWAAV